MPMAIEPTTTDHSSLTIRELGQQIRIVAEQHDAWDCQQLKCANDSPEDHQASAAMRKLEDRQKALADTVLEMAPQTLEDAAVLQGVIFLLLHDLAVNDLEPALRLGRLERNIKRAESAAARLTSFLCRVTDVAPEDAGEPCLSRLLLSYQVPMASPMSCAGILSPCLIISREQTSCQ